MSECDGLRELLIDVALGQADTAETERVAAHVGACAACEAELSALRETIAQVRNERRLPHVEVSARFKKNLTARLDAVDRREARHLHRTERTAATVTLEVVVHRLRRMPTALKVAAAILPFAIGATWLLFQRDGGSSEEGKTVIVVPPPRAGERSAPNGEKALDRSAWPLPPPDRSERDPGELTQSTLDELVGAPHRAPDVGGGEAAQPANREADRLWRERHPADLPVAKHEPAPPTPDATPAVTPVARALDWLVRTQRPDGSWAPGEGGEPGIDTGTTALALLALVSEGFVGAGDEAAGDARSHAARAAATWLFDHQSSANGAFVGGRDDAAKIFCHAVACLALVERHVRLLADDAHARAPELAREHEPLERALTRLEGDLERLRYPAAKDPAVARCAGQNAAWAAVALATARSCGVDFHLKPTGEKLIEDVLLRLRNEQPELIVATAHAVDAMAERTRGPADQAWRSAVEKVWKDPAGIEPSLRFLVASALATTRRGIASESYADFAARLTQALLAIQSPESGYFDSNRRWDFFGGGPAYETALAVMSLSVSERADQFAALRAKLAAPRAKGTTPPQKK